MADSVEVPASDARYRKWRIAFIIVLIAFTAVLLYGADRAPKYRDLFASLGLKVLPPPTALSLSIFGFLGSWMLVVVALAAALVYPAWRGWFDRFIKPLTLVLATATLLLVRLVTVAWDMPIREIQRKLSEPLP